MLVRKLSGPIAFNDARREAYEAFQESIRKEIADRKERGIPLDDDTDFAAVEEAALRLKDAASEMDGEKAGEIVRRVGAMIGGGLRELPPFDPDPDTEDVVIVLRAVSERQRIDTREQLDACRSAAERHDVIKEYVASAYEEVRGLEDEDGPIVVKREGDVIPNVDVLDEAGLISELWSVARYFAELPASKKKRFGLPPQSSSQTSSAASVPPAEGASLDATAEERAGTDSPTMSQTPVPAGTF